MEERGIQKKIKDITSENFNERERNVGEQNSWVKKVIFLLRTEKMLSSLNVP